MKGGNDMKIFLLLFFGYACGLLQSYINQKVKEGDLIGKHKNADQQNETVW